MKLLIGLFLIVLLFCGSAFANDLVVGGAMGFGKDIEGIGGLMTIGVQGSDPNTVIRAEYTSLNFGNKIDNVGAMLINYWNFPNIGFKVGHRTSIDYEVVDSDVGLATGIEFVKSVARNDVSICASIDIVKRDDIQYVVAGLGLILKIPAKK